MNMLAQQALARAKAKGAKPVPVAAVLPAAPVAQVTEAAPVPLETGGHFDRVGYLEGRRHALDIVRDNSLMLDLQGGPAQIINRLRQCMQSKPESFARGVAEVIHLVEQGVAHG